MSSLQEIASDAAFETHLTNLPPTALVVVFFHTPWAASCNQMRTVISTLASTYPVTSPPSIAFLSVNADELIDTSEKFDVTAVPFVALVRNNQVLSEISGNDVIKVREEIEKHAGAASTPAAAGAATANGATTTAAAQIPPQLSATPNPNNPAPAVPAEPETAETKEELFERLGKLVKAAPVMLFMKGTPSAPQCGFSRQIVALLRENGVKYGFFNILADEDVRQGLKEFAEWPTYPQLWMRGELVGGLDIVKEELASDPNFFKEFAVPPPAKAA
ncbi:monothiol glutaredoxin grx4 [Ascosphaera atra]|nr:monothiol glutaredoxin grx4 [Ascosphaera atra]